MLRPPSVRPEFLAAAIAACLGCATTGDSLSGEPATPITDQPDAKQKDAWATRTMTDLEQRLQAAARVEVAFVIESEGAVASHLEGTLTWDRDGMISLTATGDFAGQPQALELRGDAQTLETVVASESRWSGTRPPALIEALVIGLTRQGLLHNLAVLSGGLPPDHGDGGVSEWLEYVEPQLGPPEVFGVGEARPLEFQITVEDQLVGHATLWLGEDGVPIERRQTVNFPEGQMRVTERYTSFVIDD
jgi:hypothetical protein